jgi:hypothetical protein
MFFDLAVRDLEIALAAFALAQLSEVRATVEAKDSTSLSLASTHRA